jgi:tetratricopeptide (TPR) repeat protein
MYHRALNKDVKCGDAWYRLGLTNLKLFDPREARKDFSRAMELDPSDTDALSKLGDLDLLFYAVNPKTDKSMLADLEDVAQRLLKKDPRSFDGLRFAGEIALIRNDLKTAIRKFEAANQTLPYQPQLVLELAQTLVVNREFGHAETLARELIAKEKTYAPMYDWLYVYYLRTNRAPLAEELLKQKVRNNPTTGVYLLQLAFHYYRTGRKLEMASAITRLVSNPKEFADARLELGDFYVKIGDLRKALEQYGDGRRENPKNNRAYRKKMVEVLGTEGKNLEASALVASLLKEDPTDPEAIGLQATLLLQKSGKSQVKQVISRLQPLVSKIRGNLLLHYNLGRAFMESGEPSSLDQARLQFEQTLAIDPSYVPAMLSSAEVAFRRGDDAGAVQSATGVLRTDPANLAARLYRARGSRNMREPDRAREDLTVAVKLYPNSTDARFELARLNLEDRRYADAEAGFGALVAANDPRGLSGVIEAKSRQGHWDEALEFARNLVARSPERTDFRVTLAGVYFRAGQYRESSAQYQALIGANPRAAALQIRLGECKAQLHDFRGAVVAFERARELAPNDPAPRLNLAILYDDTGYPAEARKAYEDVLRIQPDNSTALNNLAYLDADAGLDLDRALAYAQRARQVSPNDPDVLDTLGFIYIQKNLTEDGLRMLHELVDRRPENATFHLHLALALYQKGERALARKELQAALRSKPSGKEQGKIRALLAKVA